MLLFILTASSLATQDLPSRIEGAPDGTVRMSFAAKPGVCGNGRNISTHRRGSRDGWEHDCDDGPVRVALEVRGRRVTAIRSYVGGRWRSLETSRQGGEITDLGAVSAPAAAGYFLNLAEREVRVKGDLVLPAVIADSTEAWPALLRIAKNYRIGTETRKHAVFWLSQEAGDAATRGLSDLVEDDDEDREVRKQAVFALSQLPHDQGVPALIKVARTNTDREIRKSAIFWLGQSEDPRAIALFEELLTQR